MNRLIVLLRILLSPLLLLLFLLFGEQTFREDRLRALASFIFKHPLL